jgi:hypothetical protein
VTAEDSEFFDAAYSFPHESALAAEVIRLLPNLLAQYVLWGGKGLQELD